jgi:hypothetical protein
VAAASEELGVTLPPAPSIDEAALAAAVERAQAEVAVFDPTRSVVSRLGDGGGVVTRVLGAQAAAPMAVEAVSSSHNGGRPSSQLNSQVVSGPVGALTIPLLVPSPFSTATEVKVLELRARAQAAQVAHMPRSRGTRIAIFDPRLAAESQAARSSGAGHSDAGDDVDMTTDPESQRLIAQYVKSKLNAAGTDQDGKVCLAGCDFDHIRFPDVSCGAHQTFARYHCLASCSDLVSSQ